MYKLTNLAGRPIYILNVENVFMVHAPTPGVYAEDAKTEIVPVQGHAIAVRETPAEVARILSGKEEAR